MKKEYVSPAVAATDCDMDESVCQTSQETGSFEDLRYEDWSIN